MSTTMTIFSGPALSLNRRSSSFLWASLPITARHSSGSLLLEVITTASFSLHAGRIFNIRW